MQMKMQQKHSEGTGAVPASPPLRGRAGCGTHRDLLLQGGEEYTGKEQKQAEHKVVLANGNPIDLLYY